MPNKRQALLILGACAATLALLWGFLAPADTSCGRVICLSNRATGSLPSCSTAREGFMAWDTTYDAVRVCSGSHWRTLDFIPDGG